MGKCYQRPPLVEALCEFRFQPDQQWDWTIPGLVYDKIKADFPIKRQQNVVEMELHTEHRETTQTIKGGAARMQFFQKDERALIQVGPDLLVVNHAKPYSNWRIFKDMIVRGLSVYRGVAHPKAVQRIGLRYINRIELPEQQITLEDYFHTMPSVPNSLPQVFSAWAQRIDIPYEAANGVLVLQAGSLDNPQKHGLVFVLDLDFSTLHPEAVQLDSAMDWVENAHDEVERVFESCVTEKTRALFGEVADA